MISLRVMNANDIEAGLSLCRMIGWNQLTRDWKQFLDQSPNDCRVAIKDDKIVGTVTTIKYQQAFCWISMVLVNPANQKQGIGKQLLNEAISILQNEETVKLDATPAGREVYLKLNFIDEYRLSRMTTVINEMKERVDAIPVSEDDISGIVAFDKPIFGADRQFMLEWMWKGAPEFAFMIRTDSEVKGYCMGRTGFNFVHIGPIVATDIDVAKKLLSSALNNCKGKTVAIDAMHFYPKWKTWLESIGFSEQRELTRMFKGKNNSPGIPANQFSILGPEFG